MDLLSTEEAAKTKGTSRQVIIGAIQRGDIEGEKIGGRYVVRADRQFVQWEPSGRHRESASSRWKKKK